ncbi:MAG: hypothetical protein JWO79_1601, partial [Actinomycetia bacterium]|nr:hypothetical protein [Actinomycetes bacterium]
AAPPHPPAAPPHPAEPHPAPPSPAGVPPYPAAAGQRPPGSPQPVYGQPTYGYPADLPPPPDVVSGGPAGPRRTVLWVALGGGGVLVIGLVVLLVVVLGGRAPGRDPFAPFGSGNGAPAPPLAKLCPPPPGTAAPTEPLPPPAGARLADPDAGISYSALGEPWQSWDRGTWAQGTLGIAFNRGYFVVTETYDEGEYLASVLSGKVPATVGDSLTLNLECAGRQVVDDVRNSYYPRPNEKKSIKEQVTTVGGRPAWVSEFQLSFSAAGLRAHSERVAVVLVDVGKPDAAVLYVSIPETHPQLYPEIGKLIDSVRVP